jgi:hypothetical protein
MITLDQINDFLDSIEENIVRPKKRIRGCTFDGFHLEVHSRDNLTLIMNPALQGATVADRAVSLMKEVFADRTLIVDIPTDRFERIVRGEDEIRDEEWFWNDEE